MTKKELYKALRKFKPDTKIEIYIGSKQTAVSSWLDFVVSSYNHFNAKKKVINFDVIENGE